MHKMELVCEKTQKEVTALVAEFESKFKFKTETVIETEADKHFKIVAANRAHGSRNRRFDQLAKVVDHSKMVTWFDVNHCAPELSLPFQKEHTQLIEGVVKDRNKSGLCAVLCPNEPELQYSVEHKIGCMLQHEMDNREIEIHRIVLHQNCEGEPPKTLILVGSTQFWVRSDIYLSLN